MTGASPEIFIVPSRINVASTTDFFGIFTRARLYSTLANFSTIYSYRFQRLTASWIWNKVSSFRREKGYNHWLMDSTASPSMSVVLITPTDYEMLRKTVRHLR